MIYPVGESAITIKLGDSINLETHEKVVALYNAAKENPIVGVKDIIPAYSTVTWVYDIAVIKKNYSVASAFKFMEQSIKKIIADEPTNRLTDQPTNRLNNRLITIPVHYNTKVGLDLENLAQQKAMSIETLISIHTKQTYRVYLLGFLPGFAYMGSVDARIAAPRLSQPRTSIPSGSVGIAGEQTGIYPVSSPGGWNIIGRTELKLFDPENENPILLQVGDEVRFTVVSD